MKALDTRKNKNAKCTLLAIVKGSMCILHLFIIKLRQHHLALVKYDRKLIHATDVQQMYNGKMKHIKESLV